MSHVRDWEAIAINEVVWCVDEDNWGWINVVPKFYVLLNADFYFMLSLRARYAYFQQTWTKAAGGSSDGVMGLSPGRWAGVNTEHPVLLFDGHQDVFRAEKVFGGFKDDT